MNLGKKNVLEPPLDYKALLRSQRSHPEHACLNPLLGEPFPAPFFAFLAFFAFVFLGNALR